MTPEQKLTLILAYLKERESDNADIYLHSDSEKEEFSYGMLVDSRAILDRIMHIVRG